MRNLRLESGEILHINATAGNTLQGSINYRRGKEYNAKEETHRFTHTGTGANVALFTAPVTGATITGWSIYNVGAAAANFSMRISGNVTGNEIIGLATQNRWTQDGTFTATGQLVSSGTPGTNATAVVAITGAQTISVGAKTLAYTSTVNRAWATGSRVKLTSVANVNNFMEGVLTGTPTNTAANISVDTIGGSGTFSDFVMTVSAAQGAPGESALMTASSTDSRTLGVGSLTFAIPSSNNRGWIPSATRLRIANSTTNFMEGVVTAFSPTSVTVTVDVVRGTGTFASWNMSVVGEQGVQGAPASTDIRSGIAFVPNGTLTINTTLNGNFSDHALYTTTITGGATENNLIDITNASAEKYYLIAVQRDATAGTKTINFAGAGRTYNRSWGASTQAIGVSEQWLFIVHARSATEFDVIAHKVS